MKCNCICHFNHKSVFQVSEGRTMGCGTCDFTGKVEIMETGGTTFYPITEKCKAKFIKTPWGKAEVVMTSEKGKTKIFMGKERYKHLTNPERN